LASVPLALEALYSRPNIAFVYTVQLVDKSQPQIAEAIAAIEKIEGIVTCAVQGDDVECVFLRPAESDVANAVKALGNFDKISSARSTTFERAGYRTFDDLPIAQPMRASSQPGSRKKTTTRRKA
jgi:hypothetical protein